MITLYYMALSPFCRKVRMVLDHKQLEYRVEPYTTEVGWVAKNRRAEIPILEDDDLQVVNSADIVAYLEHRYPDRPVLPDSPPARSLVRKWERQADNWADAIVTNMAIWTWANIGSRPEGLVEASALEIAHLYGELEADLEVGPFVNDHTVSVADFALYPHLSAATRLGLGWHAARHPRIGRWFEAMRGLEPVRQDTLAIKQWWATRTPTSVEQDRVNWGSYRLEMFMAMGFHGQLLDEIEAGRVLWSVGPRRNHSTAQAR
jgi:glutathione S-transferase